MPGCPRCDSGGGQGYPRQRARQGTSVAAAAATTSSSTRAGTRVTGRKHYLRERAAA